MRNAAPDRDYDTEYLRVGQDRYGSSTGTGAGEKVHEATAKDAELQI